ncbi:uncharacterized protein LOC124692404 [Lolium rigidum]|uniref:uncharacterized protein LOC124692404 n=1 Tax=Lolium rigidum TaxID=89674 RepID=UPI001F5C6A12|nr:uncharacterized protein LOC124692404 [Lolium rigidum]
MEDAASDFSDWEVLSAASAAGGDDDEDDAVLVSGQGGHVLYDHFALHPSSSEAASEEEVESGFGSVDRLGLISPEPPVDLTAAADSTAQLQLQLGGADVTAHGSVISASFTCGGATWTSARDEETEEALGPAEIEAAARGRGEPDSVPAHQEPEGILDSDATAAAGGVTLQLEQSENSGVQLEDSSVKLEDGGPDTTTESSGIEAAAPGDDEVRAAPEEEEPEQGEDGNAAPGCGESDGDGKDCSSPLAAAAAPVAGEGAERQLVVWWRLPFKLIHYCAWKVRPVWSISIAAAFLGIVVLGRRMYRMRRKTTGLPQIKIALDDKRASQFADRAARLNEAFLIAKRVPALRTSSGAALPWSMMQER